VKEIASDGSSPSSICNFSVSENAFQWESEVSLFHDLEGVGSRWRKPSKDVTSVQEKKLDQNEGDNKKANQRGISNYFIWEKKVR